MKENFQEKAEKIENIRKSMDIFKKKNKILRKSAAADFSVNSMFSGYTSLWIMFCLWIPAKQRHICCSYFIQVTKLNPRNLKCLAGLQDSI